MRWSTGRRSLSAALAALVLLLSVVAGPAAPAGASIDGGAESQFVALVNQLRSSQGLGQLAVDGELTGIARDWAGTMASQGSIFHRSNLASGVTSEWTKLGENVGMGPSDAVSEIFDAFVESPSHYANLVDPSFSRIGIGVYVQDGTLYTAHEFLAGPAVSSPAPVEEAAPAPTTAARGATPSPAVPAGSGNAGEGALAPATTDPVPEAVPAPVASAAMTSVLSRLRLLDARF